MVETRKFHGGQDIERESTFIPIAQIEGLINSTQVWRADAHTEKA